MTQLITSYDQFLILQIAFALCVVPTMAFFKPVNQGSFTTYFVQCTVYVSKPLSPDIADSIIADFLDHLKPIVAMQSIKLCFLDLVALCHDRVALLGRAPFHSAIEPISLILIFVRVANNFKIQKILQKLSTALIHRLQLKPLIPQS